MLIPRNIIVNNIRFCKDAKILEKYRDLYHGKRCFVIGNGPSLRAEDLEKIKDEFSIASNMIYLIYDKTSWRPNVFTAGDVGFINTRVKEFSELEPELKLIFSESKLRIPKIKNMVTVKNKSWFKMGEPPFFSDDITKCIASGGVVTYFNLQVAAFMGFSEIILLGVDHNYSRGYHRDKNNRLKVGEMVENEEPNLQNHFTKDYLGKSVKDYTALDLDVVELSFPEARKYADSHGIKILNATRGGKLEVFERVNFDDIV